MEDTARRRDVQAEAQRLEARIEDLDEVTIAVRTFIAASQDLTSRMARLMDTNISDMTAVIYLASRGPAGAAELADHLGMSRASTTALVDRLEHLGLVERARSTTDRRRRRRRRVSISTTPAARAAALTAWMPAIEELDTVCRSLADPDRVLVQDLLARLTHAMQRT